ncbi:alpha/beta hydrolase [uncultured Roseovarius sp.]|uniref:alpha/beta hydrolase n=1 Tax=uncultured Roseovarius sp. TaxID=293344 RepID=UPI0026209B5A|nr:alpha/beta hydrolase [uncultured Roseovarius sp.]
MTTKRLPFFAFYLVMIATVLVGCGRPPELLGVDNPEFPAASVPEVSKHQIFITTTRQPFEATGVLFSAQRANKLGLASVDVTVPPNHVLGELERARSLPPDPRREFAVVNPHIYKSENAFIADVNRALAKYPRGQRRLLIFIHGYNNTTSDAVLRLTQFVEDTEFQGVAVLYDWASAAKAPRYVYDLNSALVARVKLKEMSDILSRTKAEGIDILGHSMGAFLTMEGLVDAQQAGRLGSRKAINHIMLASPDIDIDLFRTQISLLPQSIKDKMYIFISADDRALKFSRLIAGGIPRVGAFEAEQLENLGVTVIDLSKIENSSSGSHSKFAGSPDVVQLIGTGLKSSGRFDASHNSRIGDILYKVPIRILRH